MCLKIKTDRLKTNKEKKKKTPTGEIMSYFLLYMIFLYDKMCKSVCGWLGSSSLFIKMGRPRESWAGAGCVWAVGSPQAGTVTAWFKKCVKQSSACAIAKSVSPSLSGWHSCSAASQWTILGKWSSRKTTGVRWWSCSRPSGGSAL